VDLKVTERHSNHIRDYYLGAVLSALSLLKSKNHAFDFSFTILSTKGCMKLYTLVRTVSYSRQIFI